MVAAAEHHEVVELRRAAFFDRNDVVPLEPVVDATTRYLADRVSRPECAVNVSRDPPAGVSDREDVDTLFDHDLHKGVAEQVLDGRKRHRADTFDFASLALFELTPPKCLGTDMEDDLGLRCAGAGAGRRPGARAGLSSRSRARRAGTGAAERNEGICHVGLV